MLAFLLLRKETSNNKKDEYLHLDPRTSSVGPVGCFGFVELKSVKYKYSIGPVGFVKLRDVECICSLSIRWVRLKCWVC